MKKDKLILSLFGFSALMLVASVIVAFAGIPTGAGDIIIRYDNYHNQVIWAGSFGLFFGIIGAASLVSLLNFLLAHHIYNRERFLSYILACGTAAVTFLFLVATMGIALIN